MLLLVSPWNCYYFLVILLSSVFFFVLVILFCFALVLSCYCFVLFFFHSVANILYYFLNLCCVLSLIILLLWNSQKQGKELSSITINLEFESIFHRMHSTIIMEAFIKLIQAVKNPYRVKINGITFTSKLKLILVVLLKM